MEKDTPIRHVADTAFWVATYRADESARPDRLFDDPLAARLVEGHGRDVAARMRDGGLAAWLLAIRTRIIDDCIVRAVREGGDVVVNLGAGLDTRPYRLALPPALTWIEVDFASTIDFKNERLAGEKPRCVLERCAIDLGDAEARRSFVASLDARGQKIFVLTEGVVPYLANDDVGALATELRACAHVTSWLVEYFTPEFLRMRRKLRHQRERQMVNAPLKFAPDDWYAFFDACGWAPADIHYVALEAVRYGRAVPLPLWRRVALRLLPQEKRAALAKNYGYAVLQPR